MDNENTLKSNGSTVINRIITGRHPMENAMSEAVKRIEATLPEETYSLLKEAAGMSGMTIKNFVANAITDHVLTVLERFKSVRTERIVLGPEGSRQLTGLLEHPEVFQAAHDRIKKDLEKVDISECLKVKL